MTEFRTEHNLNFEIASHESFDIFKQGWIAFRVGTCEGLWRSTDESYEILAVKNKQIGNGHLNDVFEWFENSCKRDNKSLKILEVWNESFKEHLITKRFFKDIGENNLEKKFK
jgi:hypothetical protein